MEKSQKAVSTLSRFIKRNNDDLLAVIFPAFSFENYPSTYRLVHKQVYNMFRKNNIDTIDSLRFYEESNKDISVFAFSRYDAHPNSLAHMLLGGFLTGEVWKRPSFKSVRENCRFN
jgi:hypothetical protein